MGGTLESLESQNVVGAAECHTVAWPGYMCVVMMCINMIMYGIITGMIGYAIIGLAKKKMLKMNAVCEILFMPVSLRDILWLAAVVDAVLPRTLCFICVNHDAFLCVRNGGCWVSICSLSPPHLLRHLFTAGRLDAGYRCARVLVRVYVAVQLLHLVRAETPAHPRHFLERLRL